MPADDWRRQYSGRWAVSFSADSARKLENAQGGMLSVMHPIRHPCVATGTLTILDTVTFLSAGEPEIVRADLAMDTSSAYAGAIVWFGAVFVQQRDSVLFLDLSPGCYDCGIRAFMRGGGDSLSGRWSEDSYVGSTRKGSLVLRRIP